MSIPFLIPYSAPAIKVTPLTMGGRALCSSSKTGYRSQYWEEDDEYSYGELD